MTDPEVEELEAMFDPGKITEPMKRLDKAKAEAEAKAAEKASSSTEKSKEEKAEILQEQVRSRKQREVVREQVKPDGSHRKDDFKATMSPGRNKHRGEDMHAEAQKEAKERQLRALRADNFQEFSLATPPNVSPAKVTSAPGSASNPMMSSFVQGPSLSTDFKATSVDKPAASTPAGGVGSGGATTWSTFGPGPMNLDIQFENAAPTDKRTDKDESEPTLK